MAANKKTPYVILYWFSFKIILCILILCGRVSLPTSNPGPFDIEAAREKALVKSGHVTPQILDIFVTWPYYGYASTGGELIEVTEYFLKYLSKYIARDTNQDRKINVFMSFFLLPLGSCSLNRLK